MASTSAMKVLVVEESKQERRRMVDALADLNEIVVTGAVPDVETALRVLGEHRFDILVSGLAEPEGGRLIDRARALERGPSVVVVANPQGPADRPSLAAKADVYVEKDADLRGMSEGVRDLVQRLGDPLRLIGRMAGGVAHDLNNYLCVLDVTMTLLRQHPDDQTLWVQSRAALERSMRLTMSLLEYMKGSRRVENLDLGALVRQVLQLFGRTLAQDVNVIVEIEGELPVRGVASELEQLVLNLVINASDAMPEGGELRVRGQATADRVTLEVSDQGPALDVVVHPLTGLAPSRKPGRGAVLGLGIVRSVAERHGATIQIVTQRTGARVVVGFPRAA
jgi:signal transduction histidine kinase